MSVLYSTVARADNQQTIHLTWAVSCLIGEACSVYKPLYPYRPRMNLMWLAIVCTWYLVQSLLSAHLRWTVANCRTSSHQTFVMEYPTHSMSSQSTPVEGAGQIPPLWHGPAVSRLPHVAICHTHTHTHTQIGAID